MRLIITLCLLVAGCAANEPLTPEERRIEDDLKREAEGQFKTSPFEEELERIERQY